MRKIYVTSVRQDGLRQIGRNKWELIYGLGEDAGGTYNWRHTYDHKPTLDEARSLINATIDSATDEAIHHGLVWNDEPVCLDIETQTNILGVLVAIGTMTWPLTFKLGERQDGTPVFHDFANAEEFGQFAQAATLYKQQCYSYGWQEKAAIDWRLFQ